MDIDIPALLWQIEQNTLAIAEKDTDSAILARELKDLEQQLTEKKLLFEADIATNKSAYPNDSARKAALGIASANDPECKALQARIDARTTEIAIMQVDRDDASRKRQNALAFLAYETARLYNTAPVLTGGVRS
jgi:hypothetical protein